MKRTLLFALLIFATNSISSQDLIVTNDGDTINCKITKVKTDIIYFTFKHKGEIRSTLLPASSIKTHQFNYFQIIEVPQYKVVGYENYQHFRISINGGYSYQTAIIAESVPGDLKDYIKKLKSGYHFGGDLTYYFTEPLGFGLKYYLFKSSNSMDNIYLEDPDGVRVYGKMSDDLAISFIGPSFSTRLLNNDKNAAFLMNISLGYMAYSNNKVIIDKYKMTGNTMGLSFDFGYDIVLSKNILLGFQISYLTGALSKYDWDDGKTTETIDLGEEYESLNRIDFSIGIRFGK